VYEFGVCVHKDLKDLDCGHTVSVLLDSSMCPQGFVWDLSVVSTTEHHEEGPDGEEGIAVG